jgi:hypothetical protein
MRNLAEEGVYIIKDHAEDRFKAAADVLKRYATLMLTL